MMEQSYGLKYTGLHDADTVKDLNVTQRLACSSYFESLQNMRQLPDTDWHLSVVGSCISDRHWLDFEQISFKMPVTLTSILLVFIRFTYSLHGIKVFT